MPAALLRHYFGITSYGAQTPSDRLRGHGLGLSVLALLFVGEGRHSASAPHSVELQFHAFLSSTNAQSQNCPTAPTGIPALNAGGNAPASARCTGEPWARQTAPGPSAPQLGGRPTTPESRAHIRPSFRRASCKHPAIPASEPAAARARNQCRRGLAGSTRDRPAWRNPQAATSC